MSYVSKYSLSHVYSANIFLCHYQGFLFLFFFFGIHYLHFFVAALLAFRIRYVREEKCSFNKVCVVASCFLLCEGSSGCVLKITARD